MHEEFLKCAFKKMNVIFIKILLKFLLTLKKN